MTTWQQDIRISVSSTNGNPKFSRSFRRILKTRSASLICWSYLQAPARTEILRFLEQFGYTSDMDLPQMLRTLASRMQCGNFPHEIGVFLGYPLADVQGFILNHGKNCLLCGCWKVYSDPESARRTFANYDRCRDILCDKLQQGCEFFRALELSKEEL